MSTMLEQFHNVINNLKLNPNNDINFIISCAVTNAVINNMDAIHDLSYKVSIRIRNMFETMDIQNDIDALTLELDDFEREINEFYDEVEREKANNRYRKNCYL